MKKTWRHPALGTFTYDKDRGCWFGTCELPALMAFNWEVNPKESSPSYELEFESPDGDEPSAIAAKLASLVVANHAKLASLVAPTLWNDFNGRPPNSGMWWHGDMAQVAENFGYDDRPAPKGPDDLLPVMRFSGITIHEEVYKYEKPIAELTFSAVFEEEHGIGILTDGSRLLGTGYANDASPFESE